MTKPKPKKLMRLTRSRGLGQAGRPRILTIDVNRVDGVVTEDAFPGRTQVIMLDGSTIYVRESPDEVLRAAEALECPIGVFTRSGARQAMKEAIL